MNSKMLLIDDYHVDECSGLHRVIHPGVKAEHPVLTADQPWEAVNQMGGTVRKEDSLYRMWYDSWVCNTKHNGYSSLYAESDDGINWVKPNLKKYKDFNGNINNNIYLNRISSRETTISPPITVEQDHNKNILYAPHLGTGKTYTMLAYDYAYTNYGPYDGYYLAYSDDGINWTDGPLEPVIPGHADVGWFMDDERDKMFRGIVKQYLNIRGYSRRSVLWTESKNALDWTLPKPAVIPDEIDDSWGRGDANRFSQFYGMPIFRYDSIILGFLENFRTTDGHISRDGFTFPELVSSRDGKTWKRVGDRSPIINLGDPGEWDWGSVTIGNSVIVENNEIKIYYTGRNDTHAHTTIKEEPVTGSIGLATWQIDRMVGLKSTKDGILHINNITALKELHINADAKHGSIGIELSSDGNVMSGFELVNCLEIKGDSIDHLVQWSNSPTITAKIVDIKIVVKNEAEIFSLWWT